MVSDFHLGGGAGDLSCCSEMLCYELLTEEVRKLAQGHTG